MLCKLHAMKLADYLAQPDVRRDAFASEVGISEASLSRIAAGTQNTTTDTMRKIAAASGGVVAPNDIVAARVDHESPYAAGRDGSETGNGDEISTLEPRPFTAATLAEVCQ